MTVFLLIAALLACAVLLCLLPPLLRRDPGPGARVAADQLNLIVLRDQARELDADLAIGTLSAEHHTAARADLSVRVVQDVVAEDGAPPRAAHRRTALLLTLALPLLAAALYLKVGNPDALGAGPGNGNPAAPGHEQPADMATMVSALAARLEKEPDNIDGLHMLARSYTALDRHAEAARIYARLERLLPGEAGVLADYADALGTAQGGTLKGEPERLIDRALAIDGKHVKALSLAGSAAFERADFTGARRHWEQVLAIIPPDSEFARSTAASIEAARASAEGGAALAAGPASPPEPAPAARLTGTVRLAPALAGQAAPDATVFIYARAAEGGGPPLAVLRRQVRDLPLQFVLDDSTSMSPMARLSDHKRVVVGARISRSGSATPGPGDLEGSAGAVDHGARNVMVTIETRRP